MNREIRVIQCGLGPIGLGIAREILARAGLRLVGAVDPAPTLAGQALDRLTGVPEAAGLEVTADLTALSGTEAEVAVLATTSSLEVLQGQIEPLARRGLHVVSTCEELAYPFARHPRVARDIDTLAREHGVAILGTGINPGFLMDLLPIVITAPCRTVTHLRVARVQDAGRRRLPFQRKIGAGLTPEEFERARSGDWLGHVGLAESMHMIAARLGWTLDRVEDRISPVIAVSPRAGREMRIDPGRVAGLHQTGRGFADGREVLRLDFLAAVGQEDPRDQVTVEGEPAFDLVIPGGLPGDLGTCAMVANAVRAVVEAPPGLRTMADMPPVACR